ncbi:MAG: exodeoxyribonuclease VII small subunit [Deltaproteobacteria bacterium]|jgi:exodeoxyribonuclease VII small subunit|nr:exodeoxyribonuclease VII small subunit [Deltaproteobacteria bacterium]
MVDLARSEREGAVTRGDSGEGADEPSGEGASGSLSFEGALEELEGTVARLEQGEMPLEDALELFEKGVRLSRHCTATLEAAERRIEILMADREGEVLGAIRPFESELEDDPDLEGDFEDDDDEIDSDLGD